MFLFFFQKIRKTVEIKTFSRVLQWEDAFMRSSDFGHEYSAIYVKFILFLNYVFIICVDCPTLVTPGAPYALKFLPQNVFKVKRPKLSENKKMDQ